MGHQEEQLLAWAHTEAPGQLRSACAKPLVGSQDHGGRAFPLSLPCRAPSLSIAPSLLPERRSGRPWGCRDSGPWGPGWGLEEVGSGGPSIEVQAGQGSVEQGKSQSCGPYRQSRAPAPPHDPHHHRPWRAATDWGWLPSGAPECSHPTDTGPEVQSGRATCSQVLSQDQNPGAPAS